MYQKVTKGKFMFLDKKISKSSDFYDLVPGLYPSVTDNVEAMNNLIQERHNHSENCITVKVSRRTQKVEIYFAKEGSGLAFFSTDLGHFFGSIVGNEFGVLLRRKGLHKPEFAHDIVRINFLMIYRDVIEYKIVATRKLHCCVAFVSFRSLKPGDIITTGQHMNCQTFSNLLFRPLLKNSSHRIHIDLIDTSCEKVPFVSFGITRLVLMFRKASNIHF